MTDVVLPGETAAAAFKPEDEFVLEWGEEGSRTGVKVKAFVPDWLRKDRWKIPQLYADMVPRSAGSKSSFVSNGSCISIEALGLLSLIGSKPRLFNLRIVRDGVDEGNSFSYKNGQMRGSRAESSKDRQSVPWHDLFIVTRLAPERNIILHEVNLGGGTLNMQAYQG
ncbi:hypothetical protein NM208_g11527 [Fusarium decemcellulare]|uniref:Uncharacterized protein n=1 Tax=Fusarium decemcellulare TaxID=57161 RepID=A0ACC1RSJ5_9HYPO|nr:hypothetical protein NM208_g11527 [Fusarium decemcellulare]